MSDAVDLPSGLACSPQSPRRGPSSQESQDLQALEQESQESQDAQRSQSVEQEEGHVDSGDENSNFGSPTTPVTASGRLENPRPSKRMRQGGIHGLIETASDRKYAPVDTPEYKHNHEYSLFHQLPADLMPQIIDEISRHADVVFALRLVCRDFHALFEAPFIIGPDERELFIAGLRRDDAIWYPRYERLKGLENLPKAMCSGCRVQHSKSQFSAEELNKDPESRRCVAAQNSIRVPHDRNVNFNSIRDLGPDESRAGFQKVFVSNCNIRDSKIDLKRPVLETIIAHTFKPQELQTLRQFRLLSLPRPSAVSLDDLMESLLVIEDVICEPFHSVNICVEGNEVRLRSRDNKPTPRWKISDSIYESLGTHWLPCLCSDGRGDKYVHFYSLWRRHSELHPEIDDIILSYTRNYQPHIDAADPEWAPDVVRRMAGEQIKLNEGAKVSGETNIYQASGRGEWVWDAAAKWAKEVGMKSSGCGEEDGRSLKERAAELKRKRREKRFTSDQN